MGLVKFLVDHMLGRMCRWLRIMGFDSKYVSSGYDDQQVIEECRKLGAILITRDRELASRYFPSILISSTDLNTQLRQFLSIYPFDRSLLLTRCTECNGVLEQKERGEIENTLQYQTQKSYDIFYRCISCGRTYWNGPHYRNIIKRIEVILGSDENPR